MQASFLEVDLKMKVTPVGTGPSYHYPSLFVQQKMKVGKKGRIRGGMQSNLACVTEGLYPVLTTVLQWFMY